MIPEQMAEIDSARDASAIESAGKPAAAVMDEVTLAILDYDNGAAVVAIDKKTHHPEVGARHAVALRRECYMAKFAAGDFLRGSLCGWNGQEVLALRPEANLEKLKAKIEPALWAKLFVSTDPDGWRLIWYQVPHADNVLPSARLAHDYVKNQDNPDVIDMRLVAALKGRGSFAISPKGRALALHIITVAERDALVAAARSLDEKPPAPPEPTLAEKFPANVCASFDCDLPASLTAAEKKQRIRDLARTVKAAATDPDFATALQMLNSRIIPEGGEGQP